MRICFPALILVVNIVSVPGCRKIHGRLPIYSNIENIVLWNRSEITGLAVIACLGVLE